MATRTSVIRFSFEGNASSASRALRELAADAVKAGGITQAQGDKIGKVFDDIDRKAKTMSRANLSGAVRQQAGGRLDQLAGGGAAGNLLSGLGGSEALLAKVSVGAVGAAAAIAGIGTAAVIAGQQSFAAFQSVGTAIGKFQQTLGGSTEEASRFWFTLSAAGVNPEQGLDALNQFAVNVLQNKDDLDEFGVSVAKFEDGTTDMVSTLYNVIDAYQGMGDSAERARLLSVTLGEEGMRQLQPLLRRNTDELRAMAASASNVLSEGDLKRLDNWKAASGELAASMGLAGAQIGSALAPALTALVDGMSDAVAVGGKLTGTLVDVAGVVFSPVVDGVRALVDALGAADRAGQSLAGSIGRALGSGTVGGALGNVAADFDRAAASVSRFESATASLPNIRTWQADASKSVSSSRTSLVAARADQAEATANLASAERDAARSISDANRSAAASIASASDQVASARASWSDAVADVAKAEQQAARSIADAQKGVVEASEDLARAEVDAQRTIADAAEDAAKRIVDAQKRVVEAKEQAARTSRDNGRRIVDAEQAVRDALNDALTNDNPFEASRAREEAYESLGRVREDVAESELDAARAVQEAEQGLRDATVEAEQTRADAAERAAETITQARERVADAEQRVADAVSSAAETISAAHARVAEAGNQVAAAEANLAAVTWAAEDSRARAHEEAAARVAAAKQAEMEASARAFNYDQQLQAARWQQYYAQLALFQATWDAQDPANSLTRVTGQMPSVARPGRARGGPVSAGGTYLIGEDGPELLHMGANGSVQANGTWGGGGLTVIVQGSVITERDLSEVIARAVRDGYGR